MTFLKNSIILLLLLVTAISCTHEGIDWDPHFYIGDYLNEQVIDRNSVTVMCNQPDFNRFACLHEDKVKELIDILSRAEIPDDLKTSLLKTLVPVSDSLQ